GRIQRLEREVQLQHWIQLLNGLNAGRSNLNHTQLHPMKKLVRYTLAFAALTGLATTGAYAQKFGTVDMNKVFNTYYKTKDAEAKINEARAAAKTEMEDRMESYRKTLDSINKLNEEMQKPEL